LEGFWQYSNWKKPDSMKEFQNNILLVEYNIAYLRFFFTIMNYSFTHRKAPKN